MEKYLILMINTMKHIARHGNLFANSDEQKQQKRGLLPGDVSHYLAGSIVYFNLTSGKILRTTHLELTKVREK